MSRWQIRRGAARWSVEGLADDVFRPVDRSWSRDSVVACFCCCDGADPAATELFLRAARVPPWVAAASLLEVLLAASRGGTRRWDDHL